MTAPTEQPATPQRFTLPARIPGDVHAGPCADQERTPIAAPAAATPDAPAQPDPAAAPTLTPAEPEE